MKRATVAALAALGACMAGTSAAQPSPQVSHGLPAKFAKHVDNPWYPLAPGTTYVYTGMKDGRSGRDIVTVTHRTKKIRGVDCTEVDDRLYSGGYLAERTKDWYAQDAAGNVWYFGEATAELNKSGHVLNREGSWQAGVNRAQAGLFFPAHPRVGQSARQEYYKGQAEDHFAVLTLSAKVTVPYTSSTHALLTKEWTPLEPKVLDHKLYVRGVGLVKEETIRGGAERWELTAVQHG